MRATRQSHLSYGSLVLLLAVDVLGLSAFFLDQWFDMGPGGVWLGAGVVTAVTLPGLLRLADKVFAAARAYRNIPVMGVKIP